MFYPLLSIYLIIANFSVVAFFSLSLSLEKDKTNNNNNKSNETNSWTVFSDSVHYHWEDICFLLFCF